MVQDTVCQELQEALAGRAAIAFAYLYGSFVQGLPYHDLDVALYLRPVLKDTFEHEMQLSVELTRRLGFPVDVHILNEAPLGFRHSVLQGKILLVRDEALLTDFIEQVSRAYAEFLYLGRTYFQEVTS